MARKNNIEWIPLNALKCDGRINRTLIKRRVSHLCTVFTLEGIGMLTVALRDDGYYIIDGQHRWAAAMALGLGDTKVKCIVYRDLTLAEEAKLFLLLSDSRSISAIDKFRIALIADEPWAVEINAILGEFGLRVSAGSADGTVQCIDILVKLQTRDPGLLRETLSIALAAWGQRNAATERTVLAGLSAVCARYNGEVDRGTLVKKLSKYPGGAAGIIANARGLSKIRPITVTAAAAQVVVDTYNKGRSESTQLPPL